MGERCVLKVDGLGGVLCCIPSTDYPIQNTCVSDHSTAWCFQNLLPKEGGETHIQIPCALRTRETPHVRLKYCTYMYGTRVGRSASSSSNVNTRECSKTPNPCWGMALAQQTDGLVAPEIPHQTSPTSSWQLDSTVDQGPFFAWQPSPSTHTTSNSYIAARHT